MRRRLVPALALAASVAAHGALVIGVTLEPDVEPRVEEAAVGTGRSAAKVSAAVVRADRLDRERRALVKAARAARRAGSLRLGEFLIAASRIDAEESGRKIDATAALGAFADRLVALRAALVELEVPYAIAEVFADLSYHGIPGGLVADALLARGGSCEPIAHLVAACLHDVGRAAEVELRIWGRAGGGVGHVSPIAVSKEGDFDLMSGKPAAAGGARLAAADLVEVYARAHGLAPPLAAGGSTSARAGRAALLLASRSGLTMASGYPANEDTYPGTLALFAARAIAEPSRADGQEPRWSSEPDPRDCAHQLRIGTLRPPLATLEQGADAVEPPLSLELYRGPRPAQLERRAMLLRTTEDLLDSPGADEADNLMALACLVGLGQRTAIELTLAGQRELAQEAERRAVVAADLGRVAVAATRLEKGSTLSRRLASGYSGATWLLLFLDGGDRLVTELVKNAERDDWGQVNALAGLVVNLGTRARAYEILHELPPREQIDVMHEVFLAHDQMRPWPSSFDLDDDHDFARAYRVFRALAWRLWEAARPVDEASAALTLDAAAARLGAAWEPVLFDYYVRNSLLLHVQRSTGRDVVVSLLEATRARSGAAYDVVRRRLEHMAAQPEVDSRVLADAWRIQ